jgi:hypothetical protein
MRFISLIKKIGMLTAIEEFGPCHKALYSRKERLKKKTV